VNQCTILGDAITNEEKLREYFPYVRREPNGDLVIPADRIGVFVKKYMELADNRDHLDRLTMYRNGPERQDSDKTGD